VDSVTATTVVLSGFGGTLALTNGDRLVPSNLKPSLYEDDQGTSTPITNPLTSSATGLAQCWVEFGAYDLLQTGGGLTTILHQGIVVGSEAPGQVRYADDFAANSSTGGIQEAVDDLPTAGGKVILSGKTYSTSLCVWLHNGVHLDGAGIGVTIIKRATGSIVDGDANNTGPVINFGPKGSNGTQFSVGTQGSDINISNVTLDGNYSNFTSLTNTNLSVMGIRAVYVVGLRLTNVKAQNILQDGFSTTNCTDVQATNIHCDTVGQWSVVASRNAISISVGTRFTVSNFIFNTIGDEAITISDGGSAISFSNGSVNGCDFGIEYTGSGTSDFTDMTFSNIHFINLKSYGVTIAGPAGADAYRLHFDNISFHGHATLHDGGAVFFNAATANNVADIHFNNCTWTNINSLNTNTNHWVDTQPTTAVTASRIYFNHCMMSGLSGSIRTADVGFNIRSNCQDWFVSNMLIKDCTGAAIRIDDNNYTGTVSNMHFNNVAIDGCNSQGVVIQNDATASTIKEVYFDGCVAKDCAKQTGNTGWYFNAALAASSINNIYLRGCRSFKTSGTSHAYGLNLIQSAGTLDNITVDSCDFSGTQTNWITSSGTMTNIKFVPPSDRGTDLASVAGAIIIPQDGDTFHLTGTAAITDITVNPWDNGRLIRLIWDSTATLADGANVKIAATPFGGTADDVMTLVCDGTAWYETSRSVN
jgi:hypothetical protein